MDLSKCQMLSFGLNVEREKKGVKKTNKPADFGNMLMIINVNNVHSQQLLGGTMLPCGDTLMFVCENHCLEAVNCKLFLNCKLLFLCFDFALSAGCQT